MFFFSTFLVKDVSKDFRQFPKHLTLYSGWISELEVVLLLWAESLESCSISSRRGASGTPPDTTTAPRGPPPNWWTERERVYSTETNICVTANEKANYNPKNKDGCRISPSSHSQNIQNISMSAAILFPIYRPWCEQVHGGTTFYPYYIVLLQEAWPA